MSFSFFEIPSYVQSARANARIEAAARAMRRAGLEVPTHAEYGLGSKWARSHAKVIQMVDSLHWLLPYLR